MRERNAYANDLLECEARNPYLPSAEQAFAVLLTRGTIAAAGTLDELIDRNLNKPTDIRPVVRDALRISTYELLFLGKDPHAAVSQGVELVRCVAPKAAGLANKVLRRIAVDKDEFPFADPATDDVALARQHAFPLWLAERLITDLGRDQAAVFMAASNTPAPLFLAEVDPPAPVRATDAVICTRHQPSDLPALLPRIRSGELIVADAAAQQVAALATPAATGTFLEVGSGRGTKTILLAANARRAHGVPPSLVALDNHGFKHKILLDRLAQYSITNATPVTGDATRLDDLIVAHNLPATYSGALIDAPCSGTGTLRRHPEIRWRLTPADVTAMAAQGLSILKAVAAHIAPDGFVVYATCSALTEEDQAVVGEFLASPEGAGFSTEQELTTTLQANGPDQHYAAKLRRTGA